MIYYQNVFEELNGDTVLVIMRSQKYVSIAQERNPDKKVLWFPDLSPSEEIFKRFLEIKRMGQWYKAHFDGWYRKAFMEQMKQKQSIKALSRLYCYKNSEESVSVVCSCQDESMCHRSLIRELIEYKSDKRFVCLVAGSRSINDYNIIKCNLNYLLWNYRGNVEIVSGGARGVDSLAETYAHEYGYGLTVINADWETYGKSAGYRRNRQMHEYIAQENNRGCVCFWDGHSKGTAHNFDMAKQYNNRLAIIKTVV